MDIIVGFAGILIVIFGAVLIFDMNKDGTNLGGTITILLFLLALESIVGCLLYGMRQNPVLEIEYKTLERRTETASRQSYDEITRLRHVDSQYEYTYTCAVELWIDYRFAIMMWHSVTIELPGRCSDYDSIDQHPKIREILYHWGF